MKNIEQLIDDLHFEDLRNELHPSFFDENEEYDMLIVRLPVIANELSVKSVGFIITENSSYHYNKREQKFEELTGRFEGPYKFINKIVDRMLKSFVKYQDSVSDMEEVLYEDNYGNDFINQWLVLKLEILRIERLLLRASISINELIEYYQDIPEFPMNHYIDLHEHIERIMRSSVLQLSKLDYLYSFYNAKSNDKMNKMIYILTIISAIFLPLNLVVGFFGMNTSGLPFAGGTAGTYYAISLMLTFAVVTSLIVFKWRKKVEK
jgi:magnesium transporter